MKKHYIAYEGEKFVIEWYFDGRGTSEVKIYFDKLPDAQKRKTLHLFSILGNAGALYNKRKFRHEGDQIYAFKILPDRFLCFFYKDCKIIVTNAFEKKGDKLPPKEKERALKFKDEYIIRCDKDDYYE